MIDKAIEDPELLLGLLYADSSPELIKLIYDFFESYGKSSELLAWVVNTSMLHSGKGHFLVDGLGERIAVDFAKAGLSSHLGEKFLNIFHVPFISKMADRFALAFDVSDEDSIRFIDGEITTYLRSAVEYIERLPLHFYDAILALVGCHSKIEDKKKPNLRVMIKEMIKKHFLIPAITDPLGNGFIKMASLVLTPSITTALSYASRIFERVLSNDMKRNDSLSLLSDIFENVLDQLLVINSIEFDLEL